MSSPEHWIAKVAVDQAVYRFDKPFDYLVPASLQASAAPGCRVMVPFGAANRQRQGVILSLEEGVVSAGSTIKPVTAVLDKAPLLSQEMLQLIPWLKERYFCTLFEGVKLICRAVCIGK